MLKNIWSAISLPFKKFSQSCENNTLGYSARKISAYVLLLCAVYAHYEFFKGLHTDQSTIILITNDFWAVFGLLGLVVAEKKIKTPDSNIKSDDQNN